MPLTDARLSLTQRDGQLPSTANYRFKKQYTSQKTPLSEITSCIQCSIIFNFAGFRSHVKLQSSDPIRAVRESNPVRRVSPSSRRRPAEPRPFISVGSRFTRQFVFCALSMQNRNPYPVFYDIGQSMGNSDVLGFVSCINIAKDISPVCLYLIYIPSSPNRWASRSAFPLSGIHDTAFAWSALYSVALADIVKTLKLIISLCGHDRLRIGLF